MNARIASGTAAPEAKQIKQIFAIRFYLHEQVKIASGTAAPEARKIKPVFHK